MGEQAKICQQIDNNFIAKLGRIKPSHQQIAHKKPVDHQRNIIPNQHGGNELGRFFCKTGKDLCKEIILLFLDLHMDLISRNVSDLHPRKES